MTDELVLVEKDDGLATVTLNRPEALNALSGGLLASLTKTFRDLAEDDETGVVVLTGAGRAFSAGLDLKEMGSGVLPSASDLEFDVVAAIDAYKIPVIGAINGPALGAGLALAACCDILVASENAVLGMPEIDVGLMGGAKYVNMLFPRSKARRMLLTGQRVDGRELYRMGVVEACVARDDLIGAALDIAREIASKSPLAVKVTKQALNTTDNLGLRDGYRYEQDLTVAMSDTHDAKEAQAAFVEKREPVFTGS